MKAKRRRLRNLGMVVIDYLQLMAADRKTDNRVQEVADISRNLKLLAKELHVPVICCAQLSRATEQRTEKILCFPIFAIPAQLSRTRIL